MTDTSRLTQLVLAGCALILAGACRDATTPAPKPQLRARLFAVSRTELAGTVGSAVDEAPSVIVRDSAGRPLAGVVVTFAVTDGGGVIQSKVTVSGSDGTTS